ncbi:uncharacterized protein LOC119083171 [Bradysia coprophila]|uniref:uncharacterized protein LOC119083171 n=1 Tax=Bradysia coprophila TaxID=38358 RepID=UPI00187D74F3|nr:uncharacterized protein LOC119083171 [Bradysia coprophila]
MSPKKKNKSNTLNSLKDDVDSADLIFVVSGDTSNIPVDEPNKRCKSKCPGRKFNRNLHGQTVDASQFVVTCNDAQCGLASKKTEPDGIPDATTAEKPETDDVSIAKTVGKIIETKHKRSSGPNGSNRCRMKVRGPTVGDSKWKREVILRQMKNHRISSTSLDQGSRQKMMIRPAEKLMVLQNIFDAFVNRKKWENASFHSDNLSGIMNRMGLSKYGFKIVNKSPYATDGVKKSKRARSVIGIVPRHNCFQCEDGRVPSYMGWYWTKCFSDIANAGWRPGAIPRNIRDIMSYFNGPCSCMPKDMATCITCEKKVSPELTPEKAVAIKPTLRVVRRDGLYYVCMNPLKSSNELVQSQNPYLDDCPPIKFQIALSRQLKQQDDDDLGLLGYPCSERAICEDSKEMQDLLNLLADQCEDHQEFYKLAKTLCSKPSDLDIEFVAPGANVKENRLSHKKLIYKETQYDRNDIEDSLGKSVSRSLPIVSTILTKNRK